jgi:DNA-binding beta-propeller fold protein YncE
MRRLHYLVVSCVLLSGCFGPGEGVEVPQDQIYFPVGLALHGPAGEKPAHLLVVSSDFDLQYNGGAVQSYDLSRFDAPSASGDPDSLLPLRCSEDQPCASGVCEGGLCVSAPGETPCPQGDRADADRLLFPGRCNPIDPRTMQVGTVKIGAFATDAVLRTSPSGTAQRLFVPVRGDSTLHWLDIDDDGRPQCGQAADGSCDARHRIGDDSSESTRNIELGPEPFAIDATEHAENIVVTNQTTGTATLFVNDPSAWDAGDAPTLQFAMPLGNALDPVGVAAVPLSAAERQLSDGVNPPDYTFMMTFRNFAQVRVFRSAADDGSSPRRPYLADGGGVPIAINSVGSDSRGIAIDASARSEAEAACFDDPACLQRAALVPLDVYVANRAPSSLLIGRTQPPQQYPYFFQALPLTTGPSRVVVAKIRTANDDEETRVFVVCFESRRIFVYDPKRARIEAEILTGRGPHALAVDTERRLLYVGHFTDSYIGVFSLDLAQPATYGTMLATLGVPKSPRSSK